MGDGVGGRDEGGDGVGIVDCACWKEIVVGSSVAGMGDGGMRMVAASSSGVDG